MDMGMHEPSWFRVHPHCRGLSELYVEAIACHQTLPQSTNHHELYPGKNGFSCKTMPPPLSYGFGGMLPNRMNRCDGVAAK